MEQVYGNLDKKQEYLIEKDLLDNVVVHQQRVINTQGMVLPVPGTEMIQTYNPTLFTKMTKDTDFFAESGFKVQVLHDPRIEDERPKRRVKNTEQE